MAYENLCMYCFKDANGANVCPHCGKDARAAVPQIQMLPGTPVYHDRFLVGRALGQDANGIVYNALDTRKGGTIRIREYLPRNCAERLGDGGVVPVAGMEDAFETGMRKLRASVESVEDPRKRHFYFEENGTAYIAQRKNVKGMPMPDEDDMDDEDEGRGRSVVLYLAIAAAVVLAVAIAIIWFLSSMSDPDDITTLQPLQTVSAEATWMPQETPTPTPYATATLAALVDPELSWMDYTYPGDVESEYEEKQEEVQPTRKPTIIEEENYGTVNSSSSEKKVEELQERLAELGWLDYSKITGKYGSATKQAVKDFQQYVNDYCSPKEKLAVDGIAGKKTQQWLYNSSVSLTKPTPTPEPVVTAAPEQDVVDKNSPAREIRAVQRQLIFLGLLPDGSTDGEYGSATVSAVKNFQIRVNKLQGYAALEITGKVDALTQAYLDYYEEQWQKHLEEEGEDEPEIKVTPTPEPTDAPESGTVNASSSRAEIRAVQEQLEAVGLLKKGDIDGSYGKKTVNAVKEFQEWVNEARGVETLEVTGECDPLTQRYLEYCIENGLRVTELEATATPEPTDEPEEGGNIMVDESSPKDSVMFVQEMLATIGLLDESDIDGSYGRKTISAVKEFQQFVNEYYGEKKLQLTGVCDSSTLQFLEYAYSNEWQLGEATPEPTDEPTPKPTDEPTPEPESDTVNANSSAKRVKEVQQLLAYVGLLDDSDIDGGYGKKTKNAVKSLQQFVNENKGEEVLEVTGECDPLTRKYLEYCVEQGWNLGEQQEDPTPEPTNESTPKPTDEPTPEPESDTVNANSSAKRVKEVQQLLAYVGLLDDSDIDGGYGKKTKNAVKALQQFVNENKGEEVLEVTGECDPLTRKYLEYCVEQGWNLGEGQDDPAPTEPPVQQEPDPTSAPAVSEVRGFAVAVDGVESDGRMLEITSGKHSFAWKAKSGVESFYIYLYDGSGQVIKSKTAEKGGEVTIKASELEPDEIYRLEIGALPENGAETDVIWHTIHISRVEEKVQETPEPTREPEKASVSKPTITLGSSAYQEDGVTHISGDTVIFSWMADGDVEYYNAELVFEDGTSYSLGDTTDTSKTVPTSQLEPGKWILNVGAMPVGGDRDDMKWSEFRFIVPAPEIPEEEPENGGQPEGDDEILDYIDETSDPEDIKKVQMALYEYGLIDTDRATIGVLDEATMEAVQLFQEKVFELYGIELEIVDPTLDSFIDMDTLDCLLYRELDLNV